MALPHDAPPQTPSSATAPPPAGGAATFPAPFPWRESRIALLAILVGVALVPFARDTFYIVLPLLRGFPSGDIWDIANYFGAGTGIVLIVAAAWLLRRDARRAVGLLLLAVLLCGAVVETVKYTTWRIRPRYGVRLFHEYERMEWLDRWIAKNPGTRLVASGEDQWLWWSGPRPSGDDFRSFPSGHAAAGFAFAAWLAMVFPAGRVLWWMLAVFCALSRVEMQRHYIEDAIVGSAVGWLCAHAVFASAAAARFSEAAGARAECVFAAIAAWRARTGGRGGRVSA